MHWLYIKSISINIYFCAGKVHVCYHGVTQYRILISRVIFAKWHYMGTPRVIYSSIYAWAYCQINRIANAHAPWILGKFFLLAVSFKVCDGYRTQWGEFAGCMRGCGYFVAITLFTCSTCTRAKYVKSGKTSSKSKHCLPYIRKILFILFYDAQNKDLSIMNERLHQNVACTICIFFNDALVCLVISLKFINTKFVHSLLNSITTPCMVLLLLLEVPVGETARLLPGCPHVTLPERF